jgi:hypothetical protein
MIKIAPLAVIVFALSGMVAACGVGRKQNAGIETMLAGQGTVASAHWFTQVLNYFYAIALIVET